MPSSHECSFLKATSLSSSTKNPLSVSLFASSHDAACLFISKKVWVRVGDLRFLDFFGDALLLTGELLVKKELD